MASVKNKFEIEANIRREEGKGASRRLRREAKVPAVVYGGGKEPISLSLEQKQMNKAMENEAFYSHILTLKVEGTPESVILKAVQRHPYKPQLLHIDFLRIKADEKLLMHVPLHFIGEEKAPGVVEGGGVVLHLMNDAEVSCLPRDLPEYLEVDISAMEMNQTLHLSDLKLPKGVELTALLHQDDKGVVSIQPPRAEEEPEVVEAAPLPSEVPAIEQKSEDDMNQSS